MDILKPQMEELIGIAAAVAGHCQPCFDYHFSKAKELGITSEDINAAIKIAQAVRQAGNENMDKYIRMKQKI